MCLCQGGGPSCEEGQLKSWGGKWNNVTTQENYQVLLFDKQ